jgi:hypothetical protein
MLVTLSITVAQMKGILSMIQAITHTAITKIKSVTAVVSILNLAMGFSGASESLFTASNGVENYSFMLALSRRILYSMPSDAEAYLGK